MKKIELKINDIPKVAIVGRPNVGKSTLFNIITETRKSVVKNQPGVTRDIVIEPVEIWGKTFDLIDTGGVTESQDLFSKLIKEQVTEFLDTTDLIIAVMDGRTGLVPEDRDILRLVKKSGKDFLIVINKVDKVMEDEIAKADFYEFGVDLVSCAFEQRKGISDILEWITERIPEKGLVKEKGITFSIVGKPNVGKSSLCNAILGLQRMLVSPVAGTTVDAVESQFEYKDKLFTLVDTAGLRRPSKREEDVEIISAFKSHEAIRKSQIVLLVIDAVEGPTEQDAKILNSILDDHRGVIVVANKADLAKKQGSDYKEKFLAKIQREFHFFTDVRVVFTSAQNRSGLEDLLNEIELVKSKLDFRVTTSELNDFFFTTIRKAPAPVYGSSNVKFFYLTQTLQKPPSFIAFANFPDGVTPSYRRFLINQIKEHFKLDGIPIRIFCMKSRQHGE
ncbi:MAG: ribosome biogenesis GTPase Der [Bdellovibrionaceae bacterium]|nr:ribosome biogenesis GTPase Der [Pseudobdellovibrionaceae bacterium]